MVILFFVFFTFIIGFVVGGFCSLMFYSVYGHSQEQNNLEMEKELEKC